MPTVDKETKAQELIDALKKAKIAFIAEYQGLTVADLTTLRRELRQNGAEMKIAKNTLARIAAKEAGYEKLVDYLKGPIAFFLGYETVVGAPKVAFAFAKENEILKFKMGYYAGKLLSPRDIESLASLPPMKELRVILFRVLTSPTRNLLMTMQAPMRQLIMTLEGLAKKKAEVEA